MEQLQPIPPELPEVKPNIPVMNERNPESPLLANIHQNYGFFFSISIIFGGLFTISFYKAGTGVNAFFFTGVMVLLLILSMKKLSLTVKKRTIAYYLGAVLFSASTALTANETLHFLNFIAIMFLLDLSILHQFHEDKEWDFPRYLLKIFGMIIYSIAAIGLPFTDTLQQLKHTKYFRNEKVRNVLLGIVMSIPIVWIVTLLLSQADMIFNKMTKQVFDFLFSSDLIAVIFLTVLGFVICYCILCGAASQSGRSEAKQWKKAASTIASTLMFIVCFVYVLFCAIQIVYLFANGVFVLPEGYTFAEYARRGFFELLAVTILNIVLMLGCSTLFEDSKLLRILFTCMTACTYIMIASATYRMLLYISVYHLTFLRLFVLLCLFIDALLLVGILIAEYRKSFPLFRYMVAVISVSYLIFSFTRPDYIIASYLVNHKEIFTIEDANYLVYNLSVDAAPIVIPLMQEKNRWSDELENYEESGDYNENGEYITRTTSWTIRQSYQNDYYSKLKAKVTASDIRDINLSYVVANQYMEDYSEK